MFFSQQLLTKMLFFLLKNAQARKSSKYHFCASLFFKKNLTFTCHI